MKKSKNRKMAEGIAKGILGHMGHWVVIEKWRNDLVQILDEKQLTDRIESLLEKGEK